MSATHIVSREEVMEFLDGELAPPRAMFVRAHVEGCDECRGVADSLRSLSLAIGEWRVEPAPVRLVAPRGAMVKPAPGASSPPRKIIARWPTWSWVAGAAVVTLALGAAVFGPPLRQRMTLWDTLSSSASLSSFDADPGFLLQSQLKDGNGPANAGAAKSAEPAGGVLSDLTGSSSPVGAPVAAPSDAPLIVRTASLQFSTDWFDDVLSAVEGVARGHGGSVSAYQVTGQRTWGRSLTATVRVPVADVDATLVDLRKVGTVDAESRSTEEITDAHRDLTIRIDNARREAARLNELLSRQADRLSDVLAVEQAQARVQTEIEQMVAEEAAMRRRAALASIDLQVHEQRRAQIAIGPQPFGVRLRNAAVDGVQGAMDSVLALAILTIGIAPSVLLWVVILGPIAWLVARVTAARRARLASGRRP